MLDLYVDFVFEQNGYAVIAQTREAMFPLIILDRLQSIIAQDTFFKAHLQNQQTVTATDANGQEETAVAAGIDIASD